MDWWQALILGLVQGLTEFLPVSSSGHLIIFQHLTGTDVDPDSFLGFTVLVHFATVCSTLVVFWAAIWKLLKGLFRFRYNDETDYVAKILVSMIPVMVVGLFFKDAVEDLFGEGLIVVGCCLLITALLLWLSDLFGSRKGAKEHRNGISFAQAFTVGIGQACAVAPGLSRSGTTIATGLLTGVRRDVMAQFRRSRWRSVSWRPSCRAFSPAGQWSRSFAAPSSTGSPSTAFWPPCFACSCSRWRGLSAYISLPMSISAWISWTRRPGRPDLWLS